METVLDNRGTRPLLILFLFDLLFPTALSLSSLCQVWRAKKTSFFISHGLFSFSHDQRHGAEERRPAHENLTLGRLRGRKVFVSAGWKGSREVNGQRHHHQIASAIAITSRKSPDLRLPRRRGNLCSPFHLFQSHNLSGQKGEEKVKEKERK